MVGAFFRQWKQTRRQVQRIVRLPLLLQRGRKFFPTRFTPRRKPHGLPAASRARSAMRSAREELTARAARSESWGRSCSNFSREPQSPSRPREPIRQTEDCPLGPTAGRNASPAEGPTLNTAKQRAAAFARWVETGELHHLLASASSSRERRRPGLRATGKPRRHAYRAPLGSLSTGEICRDH